MSHSSSNGSGNSSAEYMKFFDLTWARVEFIISLNQFVVTALRKRELRMSIVGLTLALMFLFNQNGDMVFVTIKAKHPNDK